MIESSFTCTPQVHLALVTDVVLSCISIMDHTIVPCKIFPYVVATGVKAERV